VYSRVVVNGHSPESHQRIDVNKKAELPQKNDHAMGPWKFSIMPEYAHQLSGPAWTYTAGTANIPSYVYGVWQQITLVRASLVKVQTLTCRRLRKVTSYSTNVSLKQSPGDAYSVIRSGRLNARPSNRNPIPVSSGAGADVLDDRKHVPDVSLLGNVVSLLGDGCGVICESGTVTAGSWQTTRLLDCGLQVWNRQIDARLQAAANKINPLPCFVNI